MRDRRKTIESLRRLAERPGTPHEGETAQRMLDQMLGKNPKGQKFQEENFPQMTEIWYAYWCYRNQHGYIASKEPKTIRGETWVRIKFDHLKQARWVPVTSDFGCHLSITPFSEEETEYLYTEAWRPKIEIDWEALLRETYRRAAQPESRGAQ